MKKMIILFFLATLFIGACTKEEVKPSGDEGTMIDPNGKP